MIELLVVIAIIAVLAGLLLPALNHAKAAAKASQCRNNLRQISLGMQMYVGDFSAYPDARWNWPTTPGRRAVGHNESEWDADLFPYVATRPFRVLTNFADIYRYRGVWRCPTEVPRAYESSWVDRGTIHRTMVVAWTTSYGYNSYGAAPPVSNRGLGLGLISIDMPGGFSPPAKDVEVKVPSDMIALADGYEVNYFNGDPGEAPILIRGNYAITNPPPGSRVAKRHSGKLNVAFCDGHLEPMTVKHLLFDNDAEWRRKWHRDNEPHMWWK